MSERDLVIGTAGHIDHGKTALVRALTGIDTDRLPAEKERGITIDLGFASLDVGPFRLALVDVPGHERFIRNMLAGATGLDLAMLIIAADDSVMPQTREHLEILQLLGLAGGVVVLTKCDLADPAWLDLVEEEVKALVRGTFLEGAERIRTSSATGMGIEELRGALGRLADATGSRDDPGLFRMAIDRAFTVAGHGTVVTGTVMSGVVGPGDELTWLPEGRSVRVRGIQRHDRSVERAGRGVRAALNLVGVHHSEIHRGQELATPEYLRPTRVISAEIQASKDAPRPLRHRSRYRVHLGTADPTATLALLETNELLPDAKGLAQLHFAEPVVAVSGQPFVLREESPPATLGGGIVLVPSARRIRRRDHAAVRRLELRRSPHPAARVAAALESYGLSPWTHHDLVRDAQLPLSDVERVVNELVETGGLIELPRGPRRSIRLLRESVDTLEERVIRALGRLHATKPRQSSVPRSHLAAELPDLGSETLLSALVDRLKTRGLVVSDARSVALQGFEPKLSQAERRLKGEIAEALRGGGFSPPDLNDLIASTGAKPNVAAELLTLLREEERATEINPQLYLGYEHAVEMRRRVLERLGAGGSITMSEFRDLLGTTRKYAVPLGEYLDRIGLTRREGDARRLGPAAETLTQPTADQPEGGPTL
ncbi:MAG: selenocysteine-specific translation elongation factor [Isosphaeraceae bacterium]